MVKLVKTTSIKVKTSIDKKADTKPGKNASAKTTPPAATVRHKKTNPASRAAKEAISNPRQAEEEKTLLQDRYTVVTKKVKLAPLAEAEDLDDWDKTRSGENLTEPPKLNDDYLPPKDQAYLLSVKSNDSLKPVVDDLYLEPVEEPVYEEINEANYENLKKEGISTYSEPSAEAGYEKLAEPEDDYLEPQELQEEAGYLEPSEVRKKEGEAEASEYLEPTSVVKQPEEPLYEDIDGSGDYLQPEKESTSEKEDAALAGPTKASKKASKLKNRATQKLFTKLGSKEEPAANKEESVYESLDDLQLTRKDNQQKIDRKLAKPRTLGRKVLARSRGAIKKLFKA